MSSAILTWTPNTEKDLAGYNVYREVGGGALTLLTSLKAKDVAGVPIVSYTDATVPNVDGEVGYALTAVDTAGNESLKSATVTKQVNVNPPPSPDGSSDFTPVTGRWDATMKTLTLKFALLLLCALLVLGMPGMAYALLGAGQAFQEDICATTAVILCDNFENRALGAWNGNANLSEYKNSGWGQMATGLNDFTIVNTQHFDGTKSFQEFFPNGAGTGTPEGRSSNFGATTSSSFPSTHAEIYVRSYVKHSSNFVWSPVANKYLYYKTTDSPNDAAAGSETGRFGDHKPWTWLQYGVSGANQLTQNVGNVSLNADQWYCIESHLKMNTAGQSNGLIEMWIDPATISSPPVLSYPNLSVSSTTQPFIRLGISGFWNCAEVPCSNTNPASQHPDMYRWHDNIVVSTQRIGCLGVSPPPSVASNISTITAGGAITATVNNGPANATDFVGMFLSTDVSDNAHMVDWFYLNGSKTAPASGVSAVTLNFTAPASAGTYQFRFFAAGNFNTLLATSNNFTVTVPSAILPFVTSVATDGLHTTIIGAQDSTDPAAQIRLCYGGNSGTPSTVCPLIPIASVVGWPASGSCASCTGIYTFTYPPGVNFTCGHAQDALGREDPNRYHCNQVIPAVDTTPPAPPTGIIVQ